MSSMLHKFDYAAVLQGDDEEQKKLKRYSSFLDHSLPYISALMPKKNANGKYSFSSVMDQLRSGSEIEVFGDIVNTGFIMQLIKVIGLRNRSEITAIVQTKNSRYSSATPWVLYAYKMNHNINYEDWDWSEEGDDRLKKAMLGKSLEDLILFKGAEIVYTPQELKSLREEALTQKKDGKRLTDTSNRLSTTGDEEFDRLPKCIKYMLLQTWVYHPSLRSSAMITDLHNFDKLADPLFAIDASLVPSNKQLYDDWGDPIIAKSFTKPKKVEEDLPW